jgi:hypothetical protein
VLWEALRRHGSWPDHWSPTLKRALTITVALLALVSWGWGVRAGVRSIRWHRKQNQQQVVAQLQRHAGAEGVVFSDAPMWVYRAGLRTPAYWAVPTSKRLSLQGHGWRAITDWITEHRPEQVLIARWQPPPKLLAWLDEHYLPVELPEREGRLWVRPQQPGS